MSVQNDISANKEDGTLDANKTAVSSVVEDARILSEDTLSYLREKRIPDIMEYLMRSIIAQKPSAPLSFIHELTSAPYTPRIIIVGPPASGKGTQCEQIIAFYRRKKTGICPVHISSGELIRDEIEKQTQAGKIADSYVVEGRLIPDNLVFSLIRSRMEKSDVKANGWILDGFPRNNKQILALDAEGHTPDLFIQLVVSDEVLFERVEGRRLDPATDMIYHLKFNPPPENDTALLDRLIQRKDDTREALIVRLQEYNQTVASLVEHYASVRVCLNANKPMLDVLKDLDAVLEKAYIH